MPGRVVRRSAAFTLDILLPSPIVLVVLVLDL